jgi:hypothetical protein
MTNIMIDLETMGLRLGCVIASIGAVAFDPYADTIAYGNGFYADVDMTDCQRLGLVFDASTVSWWLGQSNAARGFLLRENRWTLAGALSTFRRWWVESHGNENTCVWSHGATFDIPIMEHAFRACTLQAPWSYRNVRDTRTIYAAAGVSTGDVHVAGMVPHYAADDAYVQALAVQKAYQKLGLKRS